MISRGNYLEGIYNYGISYGNAVIGGIIEGNTLYGVNEGIGIDIRYYINRIITSDNYVQDFNHGIYVYNYADQIMINNNICYSNDVYGIVIASASCDDCLIDGNICKSNGTAEINDTGTGTTVGDNET